MRRVTILQAENDFRSFVDLVKSGESVLILDGDTPVARLEPVVGTSDGRAERLERAGLARRGRIAPPVDLIMRPGPAVPDGASVVEALLEERREGP